MKTLQQAVAENGDKIVYFRDARADKQYQSVFDYCTSRNLLTYNSHRYYNDFYIELNGGL